PDSLHAQVDGHGVPCLPRGSGDWKPDRERSGTAEGYCDQGATPSTVTSFGIRRLTSLTTSPSITARQRATAGLTTSTWVTPRARAARAIVLAYRRVVATWPQASTPD